MAGRLDGKVALVTGAARGLGEAIATRFSAEGALVYLADIRDDLGERVAETIRTTGGKAEYVHLDVTREDDWAGVAARFSAGADAPDILVNNAFVTTLPSLDEETLEGWRTTLDVILTGAFLGMRAVIPLMRTRPGGAIVTIGSIHGGGVACDGRAAYQAAKGGLNALTRHAAVTYARDGIRANIILPGPMDTPVVAELGFSEQQEAFGRSLPLGRVAAPAEVANAALYLASDEASFVTGASLTVDGGFTAL